MLYFPIALQKDYKICKEIQSKLNPIQPNLTKIQPKSKATIGNPEKDKADMPSVRLEPTFVNGRDKRNLIGTCADARVTDAGLTPANH
jgi:hypothetical protein